MNKRGLLIVSVGVICAVLFGTYLYVDHVKKQYADTIIKELKKIDEKYNVQVAALKKQIVKYEEDIQVKDHAIDKLRGELEKVRERKRVITGKIKNEMERSKNEEGKIWLETQVWALISGVAEGERAIKCADSIKKYLYTKYGIVLFYPAFSKYSEKLGYVSVFPKGLKENAAIFCHTNPWAMVGEAIIGRGENAYLYYKTILPYEANKIADIH